MYVMNGAIGVSILPFTRGDLDLTVVVSILTKCLILVLIARYDTYSFSLSAVMVWTTLNISLLSHSYSTRVILLMTSVSSGILLIYQVLTVYSHIAVYVVVYYTSFYTIVSMIMWYITIYSGVSYASVIAL